VSVLILDPSLMPYSPGFEFLPWAHL